MIPCPLVGCKAPKINFPCHLLQSPLVVQWLEDLSNFPASGSRALPPSKALAMGFEKTVMLGRLCAVTDKALDSSITWATLKLPALSVPHGPNRGIPFMPLLICTLKHLHLESSSHVLLQAPISLQHANSTSSFKTRPTFDGQLCFVCDGLLGADPPCQRAKRCTQFPEQTHHHGGALSPRRGCRYCG